MASEEETARLASRIDAIEQTLMVQTGALSSAKEQADNIFPPPLTNVSY